MSLYVISKSRYDHNGTLTHVEWAMADGERAALVEPHKVVSADRVIEALDRGDTVEMRHTAKNGGWVSSGKVVRRTLANGDETIVEERQTPSQMLSDLPPC